MAINEQHHLSIGGVEQWLQIRGDSADNPVLLVLHGGPGSPYAVFGPLIRSWERHFTVVQWDRRGCGKTRARGTRQTAPFARHLEDAIEVTEFLRAHLRQDKIVLMAGSMGTIIGLPLAQQRPDLYSALVTTDLYADMRRNEALGHARCLERVRAAGNTRAVRDLERIGGDPAAWDLRAWQTKMKWTMATDPVTPNAVSKLLFPLALRGGVYTKREAWHLLAGFMATQKAMFGEYMAFNAYDLPARYEVPVFVFQGADDVLTLTDLAQEYFAHLDAPHKEIALIEDASHFAAFTQPERFGEELVSRVLPVVRPRTGAAAAPAGSGA
ncbi:proline iminopeptidase [Catellatospora sp. TT07R-123]|uniref:alpha/beta fold hydrolase n=1 Tax=Catellatospora sp. TT07R-123 TaxID=2733863 RepID=UPI001B0A8D91|nr:alpha/beta hydrolase [Catellatospora sp. TT07R-123]GHJ43453.1 proline iminopeptidase [Catellatospora sp. TT07R-123]